MSETLILKIRSEGNKFGSTLGILMALMISLFAVFGVLTAHAQTSHTVTLTATVNLTKDNLETSMKAGFRYNNCNIQNSYQPFPMFVGDPYTGYVYDFTHEYKTEFLDDGSMKFSLDEAYWFVDESGFIWGECLLDNI